MGSTPSASTMENFWKGAILGKHRDYQHNSFLEHIAAAGGLLGWEAIEDLEEDYTDNQENMQAYMLARDPLTGKTFDSPRKYFALVVMLRDIEYTYLIPAKNDGSVPDRQTIASTLDAYMHNQVQGGRNISEYLA